MSDFDTISKAITTITNNPKINWSLENLSAELKINPTTLQKTFTHWAGISPKQLQRYLSLEYAKIQLNAGKNNLQTTALTGLSSLGRLHDLFVDIEAMTPYQYKNKGQNLIINYSLIETAFGLCLVAATKIGVCNVLFGDTQTELENELRKRWKNATLILNPVNFHQPIFNFLNHINPTKRIKLHLHGTNYQLKVWQALLTIPEGKITSYGQISKQIGDTSSFGSRATGAAIGANPVGYIIPCHRVLKSTGAISGYRWGVIRKQAILALETHKISSI
jgi:AraC family transcriptional regulator, regulatory protein of adaptative response / methylated-DNA-[protein]-cysteine methyltransferase